MPENLRFTKNDLALQSSIRGLYGTSTAPLPFLKSVVVRAFLLERPQGNIIVYNAPGISTAADEIRDLGRLDRLLLNHCHEGMYGAPKLDVPVCVHAKDRSQSAMPIAGTFSERHMIGDDLTVIPTPGHTPGATMFLWDNGEHRLLFSGDSVWVQGGEWKAVLLGDSDRSAYLDSLSHLMEVDFDILVPWVVEMGEPYGYAVTRAQAKENLARIAARLKAGESA